MKATLKPLGSILHDGWEKIYDYTVAGSAVTSLTISGLNGDVDEEYILESKVVNAYNGECGTYFRPNNDVAANYAVQELYGASTTAGASSSNYTGFRVGYGNGLNELSMSVVRVFAKSGYLRTGLINKVLAVSGTTVGYIQLHGVSWSNIVDNIVSATIAGDQAGCIGVGSQFVLYRKARRS